MLKTRYFTIYFTLVVAAGVMLARSARAADDAKAAEDPQRQLISVLQSDRAGGGQGDHLQAIGRPWDG